MLKKLVISNINVTILKARGKQELADVNCYCKITLVMVLDAWCKVVLTLVNPIRLSNSLYPEQAGCFAKVNS